MNKKNHSPGPVPPGNQSHAGPGGGAEDGDEPNKSDTDTGAPFQDQDAKRRLGGYGGAGEHPRQQPGRMNDGDVHSR